MIIISIVHDTNYVKMGKERTLKMLEAVFSAIGERDVLL